MDRLAELSSEEQTELHALALKPIEEQTDDEQVRFAELFIKFKALLDVTNTDTGEESEAE